MTSSSIAPAAIAQPAPQELALTGCWTALGVGTLERKLDALKLPAKTEVIVDGAGVESLDTAGVWIVQKLQQRLRGQGGTVQMRGWSPQFAKLLEVLGKHPDAAPAPAPRQRALERLGRGAAAALEQGVALLSFLGESALALAGSIAHPERIRWRPILHNIQSAGWSALPSVGLLSFLLGIVVAYQGADTLRRYGANIYVADLVGLSMLREFAPLITAIIVAGRSGSAYAAQIGTMQVKIGRAHV